MMYFINLLVVLVIPLLGFYWSNRRYVARGRRLKRRWNGRMIMRFLVVTGVLAMVSLAILLCGSFYRFGRQIGLASGLAVFVTVICILILFVLYERFLVYLIGVGSHNSRLRAQIAAKSYVERQRRQQIKAASKEQTRWTAPLETESVHTHVSMEQPKAKTSSVSNRPGKIIPFPKTTVGNAPIEPETKTSRKMFATTDDEPATTENIPLAELKVLAFNLGGCRIKANDCGETVLLQLAWVDEKGRKRSGKWRLDKNSPDYLWVVEQATTIDVEVAQELLNMSAQTHQG